MPRNRHSTQKYLDPRDQKLIEETRKIINETSELLDEGPPDTFLGRETHQPFLSESDKPR
ncbi:hypothetical protein Q3C01_05210 [Bradyrhizobium sp. UFLA05-109]